MQKGQLFLRQHQPLAQWTVLFEPHSQRFKSVVNGNVICRKSIDNMQLLKHLDIRLVAICMGNYIEKIGGTMQICSGTNHTNSFQSQAHETNSSIVFLKTVQGWFTCMHMHV